MIRFVPENHPARNDWKSEAEGAERNFSAAREAAATMCLMCDAYQRLLDAAIQHLRQLSAQGVRFVSVSPETLAALNADVHAPVAEKKSAPPVPTPPAPRSAGLVSAAVAASSGSKPAGPSPAEPAPAMALDLSLGLPGEMAADPAPLNPEAKAAAFAELRQRALVCVKCPHLASSRKNVVFGVGSIDTEVMFVGEAPGADEDEQGEPFVGKAGQLLTRVIQTMGLTRESVYIANILKCRPDTPGQSAGNRKPTGEEMATCIPYLHEQIDLIRPKVIVALGATAVEGLLGKTVGITRLRGNWRTYRGLPLMPTYHPAYLLRNQALGEKRKVWEDMLQVMERLGMPVSEKQRNFFLKA
jgi:DNA polymerase